VLETVLISFGVATLVSTIAIFASSWEQRIRLRRLEVQLAEYDERLVREVKQRAAAASVAARQTKLNPLDEALIRQHTGVDLEAADQAGPWWGELIRK